MRGGLQFWEVERSQEWEHQVGQAGVLETHQDSKFVEKTGEDAVDFGQVGLVEVSMSIDRLYNNFIRDNTQNKPLQHSERY